MMLFDIPPLEIAKGKTCKTCEHIERLACGGSFFFYCGVRKSNLTANKQLKVKCKTPACLSYKQNTP